jgi:hypothetical protein
MLSEKPTKSSKTRRRKESVRSKIKRALPNYLSYIGRFMDKNEFLEIFLKKVSQKAAENRLNQAQKSLGHLGSSTKLNAEGSTNQKLGGVQENSDGVKINPASNTQAEVSTQNISKNYQNSDQLNKDSKDNAFTFDQLKIEFFTYEDLEEQTISLILSNKYMPINVDEFQALFRVLDPQNTGSVKVAYLVQLLKEATPTFSDNEIQRFLNFAGCKPNSETVNYNDYIINFYEFVNSHIKKLYRQKENLIYS